MFFLLKPKNKYSLYNTTCIVYYFRFVCVQFFQILFNVAKVLRIWMYIFVLFSDIYYSFIIVSWNLFNSKLFKCIITGWWKRCLISSSPNTCKVASFVFLKLLIAIHVNVYFSLLKVQKVLFHGKWKHFLISYSLNNSE